LKSRTFTAHPKFDPDTGDMLTMGYEAKGDGTNDVCYMHFDKNGKKMDECWIKTPHCGMMHGTSDPVPTNLDFCFTKNYVVFHVLPLHCSIENLKKDGNHFHWEDDIPLYFGILPRHNPKSEDIKWFHNKLNAYIAHIGNAYDGPYGVAYYDSPLSYGNKFVSFFPSIKPDAPLHDPAAIRSHYVRWKLDPRAKSDFVEPVELADVDGEMPTIDLRYASLPYTYVFMAWINPGEPQAVWYVLFERE